MRLGKGKGGEGQETAHRNGDWKHLEIARRQNRQRENKKTRSPAETVTSRRNKPIRLESSSLSGLEASSNSFSYSLLRRHLATRKYLFALHFSAMTLPAPLVALKSSSDSPRVPTHTRLRHRRPWERSLLIQVVVLGLLLVLVVAQSNGGTSISLPPAPQPGPDLNNQGAMAPSADSPSPTQNSGDKPHDSTTASATITASAAPPKPTTITTVTVINGTTTTLTLTITPTQAAAPAAQPPPPTSIPKAPQSVLVVQSISYGKVLPAAGPADDQMESHFWDQFLPKEGGAKASDGSLSYLWRGSSESTTLVWTMMMVIVTVALLSR